jgi:hypothetical protein
VRRFCLVFFMLFVSLCAAYAQETAGLSDEQLKERLSFIETALRSARPHAQTWWYGWIAGYSAGAIVQAGLSAANWNKKDSNREFAEDMLVGSVTCALGVGGLLIKPFAPAYGAKRLRLMPEGTPEERRVKLLKAEELLRECAQREREGQGWLTHLLNIGVNIAGGLVTVFAFDRPWSDGFITFVTNEAVSLLNIYTQPRRAVRDLNKYETKYLSGQGIYTKEPGKRKWFFSVYLGGFSVGTRF